MDERSIISFSKGEIEGWRGLRAGLSIEELNGFFGGPVETNEECLGYYPAAKYTFPGGLIAYVRQQAVVLIETPNLPASGILEQLPSPDAVLPHEIWVDGAYAYEYIYCARGLDLTVAEYFDEALPNEIVRCRGFERIEGPGEFDARYHRVFEDNTLW
jgi:hypothetical protein